MSVASVLSLLDVVGKAARNAYNWWLSEIQEMVPDRLKRFISRRRKQMLLDISSETLVLREGQGQTATELVRLPAASSEAEYAEAATIVATRKAKTTLVRLPGQLALRKRITLPAPLERTLPAALRFELERQTPYNANDVYFDHRVVARQSDRREIDIELSAVDRETVDNAVRAAETLGLEPSAVILNDDHNWPPTFDFMRGKAKYKNDWTRLQYCLVAVAILLLSGTVVATMHHEAKELQHLSKFVDDARQEAVAAANLAGEIERGVAEINRLDQKKMQTSVLSVLRDLTVLLPDHTWIAEFNLTGATGRISGYSRDAAALIGMMDRSNVFQNANFTSPVTHDRDGLQRFGITFDVAPRTSR